jgi:hypothetical protein
MMADLFREFDWSASKGTLVQTAFPGIFPDLTRYQAEADQAQVNQGHDTWKNDPQAVAKALVVQFFGWQRALTTKLLSGGGPQDVEATVQVQEAPVQGGPTLSPSVIVTLSRLEGNTHNMWVAIGVKDGTALTLTNIQPKSLIASPVKLEGKGSAFENTVGMAYILDHLYTKVGQAIVTGKTGPGMGTVTYSTQVSYDTSFKQGPQEGVVEVQWNPPIEAGPQTAVMVKVLLNQQPGVILGPVSCPIALQQPGYWETVLGIDTSTASVGTASCGNLKGDPSLQALVPVYYTNGQPSVSYVYDHIIDAHPVQLFKLQTTSAMISGVSTINTRDGDLYREFRWSSSDGKFVQVAFPGMYPDLTRGQAEADQAAVNNGQDSWKLDAAKVAQSMAVQLLKWSSSSQATIVSGGGSQNVDALVQVKSTSPDHPVINVTLSRLEGDTHNMWVVIAVADGSSVMSITSPHRGEVLTSPVTVKGTGSAFEGDVGTVFVLDHLYTDIGHAKGVPATNGKTPFTATVPYTASFHGGVQEGVLAFYRYSEADGAIAGAVMVKVLISG